jgi:hypothetical protein
MDRRAAASSQVRERDRTSSLSASSSLQQWGRLGSIAIARSASVYYHRAKHAQKEREGAKIGTDPYTELSSSCTRLSEDWRVVNVARGANTADDLAVLLQNANLMKG